MCKSTNSKLLVYQRADFVRLPEGFLLVVQRRNQRPRPGKVLTRSPRSQGAGAMVFPNVMNGDFYDHFPRVKFEVSVEKFFCVVLEWIKELCKHRGWMGLLYLSVWLDTILTPSAAFLVANSYVHVWGDGSNHWYLATVFFSMMRTYCVSVTIGSWHWFLYELWWFLTVFWLQESRT